MTTAITATMTTTMKTTKVLLLECCYDDGEHDPHTAEQCGVFADADAVRSYVEKRFPANGDDSNPIMYRSKQYGDADNLTWELYDHTGKQVDLVLITWIMDFYSTGLEEVLRVS